MGRAPCCEKMGLKKGPWTSEEDLILINFINLNGHGNWRALPKRAGLLRCGKSCRLRWMNYLRPDIKRGNFTPQEEEIIIKLHQQMGNRWSVIASRLPGRTDNEIKNIWHAHLKKRLNEKAQPEPEARKHVTESSSDEDTNSGANSPMHSSSSEVSSVSTAASDNCMTAESPEMDESFWSGVLSETDWCAISDFVTGNSDSLLQFPDPIGSDVNEAGGDFWYSLFNKADHIVELPEF